MPMYHERENLVSGQICHYLWYLLAVYQWDKSANLNLNLIAHEL